MSSARLGSVIRNHPFLSYKNQVNLIMSFSAFLLFFLLVIWLAFVPKWMLRQIQPKKDKNTLYSALHKIKHALPVLLFYLFVALVKVIYQHFETTN